MKYSKQITNFCETDKCEYFSFKQLYVHNWNTGKMQAAGKQYICSHPAMGEHRVIVKLECPMVKR